MQARFKRQINLTLPFIKRVLAGLAFLGGLFIFFAVAQILISYQITPAVVWQAIWGQTTHVAQAQGRTNIVLLGIGGADHDSPDLTDTIMIASIDLASRDIVLVSLPRDIWIPSLKDKINSAYHLGNEKNSGSGLTLAKSAVEEVVGLPIHYGVLIDFSGFIKMIDGMGGIDVTVSEAFTDPLYPIMGKENDECGGDPDFACRFESVTFTAGVEHMNGTRALKFVRSRHAEGEAGTDFSRGRRQQAVIVALKNKLIQKLTLADFQSLKNFLDVASSAIVTDLPVGDVLLIGRIFVGTQVQIRTVALSQDEPEKEKVGLLVNPPLWQYRGKWVLVPKHDGFGQIGKYVACVIENTGNCDELMK